MDKKGLASPNALFVYRTLYTSQEVGVGIIIVRFPKTHLQLEVANFKLGNLTSIIS